MLKSTCPTTGNTVLFRRLTGADTDQWVALTVERRRACALGTFGDQALAPDDIDTAHLGVLPVHGSTFGVEVDGRLVGCARVRTDGDDVWVLSTVYVKESLRGRGLGRALVQVAIAAVPPDMKVELWVAADNAHAKAMYRSLGFAQTSVVWLADPAAWTHMRFVRPRR